MAKKQQKYTLPEVIAWKYGYIADTKQVDPEDLSPTPKMVISAWRHPTIEQPSEAQLKKDLQEYVKMKEAKTAAKQKMLDRLRSKTFEQLTPDDITD